MNHPQSLLGRRAVFSRAAAAKPAPYVTETGLTTRKRELSVFASENRSIEFFRRVP